MATPPYKWYSLSEMIAERDWKEMRPYDQPEKKIDHDKIRNIHGRFDNRPEIGIWGAFCKIPHLSNYFIDHLMSVQSSKCAPIERRMANCLEAYGLPQSYTKCELLIDDFTECITHHKQMKRVQEMRRERHRQFRDGEREFKYAPPPKLWSYEY